MIAAYSPFYKQRLKTDAKGVEVDRSFIAHYVIAETNATAPGVANVLAATALTAEVQEITTGITQPKVPRVLSVKGNDAKVAGNVVIEGTDFAGATITDTIVAAGTGTIVGAKAFATITKITLPPYDTAGTETISIGLADAFGIPYKLPYDTILKIYNGGTATTVASSSFSATVLSSNYIAPTAGLNGTQVDVYLIV